MNTDFSVQVGRGSSTQLRECADTFKLWSVLAILYGPAIFLAKLSILLLYLEIFSIDRRGRITIFIAIGIIAAHCLADITGFSVLCVPTPGISWDTFDDSNNCKVVADALSIAMGSISVFSDLLIIYIPIPLVWKLQLSTRKKIGVTMIFVTGIL